jgi:hypothetical protein
METLYRDDAVVDRIEYQNWLVQSFDHDELVEKVVLMMGEKPQGVALTAAAQRQIRQMSPSELAELLGENGWFYDDCLWHDYVEWRYPQRPHPSESVFARNCGAAWMGGR